MLARIRAEEDQVTPLDLSERNLLADVVLVAAVVRELDADGSKCEQRQARAIKSRVLEVTEGIGNAAVADPDGGAVDITTPQEYLVPTTDRPRAMTVSIICLPDIDATDTGATGAWIAGTWAAA